MTDTIAVWLPIKWAPQDWEAVATVRHDNQAPYPAYWSDGRWKGLAFDARGLPKPTHFLYYDAIRYEDQAVLPQPETDWSTS